MSMAITQSFMMTRSGRFENSVLIYYMAEYIFLLYEN